MKTKLNLSIFFLIVGILMTSYTDGTTTSAVFKKYPNKYFIETGSFIGDGIQNAIDTNCFQQIHSIEISPTLFQGVTQRFVNNPNVHIWLGDSSIVLGQLVPYLTEPATFWLDAHHSYAFAPDVPWNELLCPILLELDIIKNSPIKNHTILIDDVRLFGTQHFDYIAVDLLKQKLLEINPNYTILFEEGVIENDVLVAFIKK